MKIKVLENTPEQLVVRMVPIAAPIVMLFGLLFLLGGLLTIWLLGYNTDLKIQSGELQFRRAFWGSFDANERTIPVEEIRTVDTQVYASMGKTLDVTIHTRSESLRVPFDNLDGDAKERIALRLKEAIASGSDFSENSGTDLPMMGTFLGAFMSFGGVICLFFLQTSTIVGSRSEDSLGVRISRWLLPYKRESNIDLSNFGTIGHRPFSVVSHCAPDASSNSVFVQTNTGESLKLAAGPMFTDGSTEEIKQIVEGWVRAANRAANYPAAMKRSTAMETETSF